MDRILAAVGKNTLPIATFMISTGFVGLFNLVGIEILYANIILAGVCLFVVGLKTL